MRAPDLMYLSTTDMFSTRPRPGTALANDVLCHDRRYSAELDWQGADHALATADHGMNDKHLAPTRARRDDLPAKPYSTTGSGRTERA